MDKLKKNEQDLKNDEQLSDTEKQEILAVLTKFESNPE